MLSVQRASACEERMNAACSGAVGAVDGRGASQSLDLVLCRLTEEGRRTVAFGRAEEAEVVDHLDLKVACHSDRRVFDRRLLEDPLDDVRPGQDRRRAVELAEALEKLVLAVELVDVRVRDVVADRDADGDDAKGSVGEPALCPGPAVNVLGKELLGRDDNRGCERGACGKGLSLACEGRRKRASDALGSSIRSTSDAIDGDAFIESACRCVMDRRG